MSDTGDQQLVDNESCPEVMTSESSQANTVHCTSAQKSPAEASELFAAKKDSNGGKRIQSLASSVMSCSWWLYLRNVPMHVTEKNIGLQLLAGLQPIHLNEIRCCIHPTTTVKEFFILLTNPKDYYRVLKLQFPPVTGCKFDGPKAVQSLTIPYTDIKDVYVRFASKPDVKQALRKDSQMLNGDTLRIYGVRMLQKMAMLMTKPVVGVDQRQVAAGACHSSAGGQASAYTQPGVGGLLPANSQPRMPLSSRFQPNNTTTHTTPLLPRVPSTPINLAWNSSGVGSFASSAFRFPPFSKINLPPPTAPYRSFVPPAPYNMQSAASWSLAQQTAGGSLSIPSPNLFQSFRQYAPLPGVSADTSLCADPKAGTEVQSEGFLDKGSLYGALETNVERLLAADFSDSSLDSISDREAEVDSEPVGRRRAAYKEVERADGFIQQMFSDIPKHLPVIGLGYLVVLQERGDGRIKCRLCSQSFGRSGLMQHVFSIEHRKNYLRMRFPSYFKKVAESSQKMEGVLLLLKVCRKVERMSGRGQPLYRVYCGDPPLDDDDTGKSSSKRNAYSALHQTQSIVLPKADKRPSKHLPSSDSDGETWHSAVHLMKREWIRDLRRLDLEPAVIRGLVDDRLQLMRECETSGLSLSKARKLVSRLADRQSLALLKSRGHCEHRLSVSSSGSVSGEELNGGEGVVLATRKHQSGEECEESDQDVDGNRTEIGDNRQEEGKRQAEIHVLLTEMLEERADLSKIQKKLAELEERKSSMKMAECVGSEVSRAPSQIEPHLGQPAALERPANVFDSETDDGDEGVEMELQRRLDELRSRRCKRKVDLSSRRRVMKRSKNRGRLSPHDLCDGSGRGHLRHHAKTSSTVTSLPSGDIVRGRRHFDQLPDGRAGQMSAAVKASFNTDSYLWSSEDERELKLPGVHKGNDRCKSPHREGIIGKRADQKHSVTATALHGGSRDVEKGHNGTPVTCMQEEDGAVVHSLLDVDSGGGGFELATQSLVGASPAHSPSPPTCVCSVGDESR